MRWTDIPPEAMSNAKTRPWYGSTTPKSSLTKDVDGEKLHAAGPSSQVPPKSSVDLALHVLLNVQLNAISAAVEDRRLRRF